MVIIVLGDQVCIKSTLDTFLGDRSLCSLSPGTRALEKSLLAIFSRRSCSEISPVRISACHILCQETLYVMHNCSVLIVFFVLILP